MYLSCFLRNVNRFKITSSIISRHLCTKTTNSEFTPVYKFPYIRTAGVVNRLKVYQGTLTAVSIPGSILLCSFGLIPADSVITTIVLGISGTLSLFLFGMISDKLIGFVYVKDDEKTVKLSYVDFWGRRKDIELPMSDIVPLTDLPAIPTDPIYLTMRRYSSPETFKINLKYGIVLEKKKFNNVFLQEV